MADRSSSNAVANAPPLPERPDLPQADDLEDVKKVRIP